MDSEDATGHVARPDDPDGARARLAARSERSRRNAWSGPRKDGKVARTRSPAAAAPPTASRFAELGPPPTDPIAANEWAHRVLSIAMFQAMHDPNLTEGARRGELVAIAGRMAPLTPMSRLKQAEDVVMGRHLASEDGPMMEPVTDATSPAVASAPSGGAALRGRPRKRALR